MRNAALTVMAGLIGATLAGQAAAAPRCQNTGSFEVWVDAFKKDAVRQGISPKVVAAVAPELTFDQSVINRDHGQAVFQRTFLDFAKRLIGGPRIPNGRAKIKEHAALFARIEKAYGVPPEVIAAVWGLESDYGALFGKFKILPSLATLAYDCRRGEHFRPELMDALRIIQRGDQRIDEMNGNWAGEFGGMQFTPSNYVKYGVDFDGDGRRDLIKSIPDTLASAANYLKQIGRRRGEPWLQEVRVPDNLPWQEADLAIQHPVSQWAQWGVRAAHGSLPRNLQASLILPMGRQGPAFLAYPNFKVFIEWNSAYVYSTTVAYFATRLGGAPAVSEEGAGRVKQLSTEQMMDLQRELARRGFDVGEVDGKLGSGTRAAVKKMQLEFHLPADSWPTEELIARLHDDKTNERAPQASAPPAHSTPRTAAEPAPAHARPEHTASHPPARAIARPAHKPAPPPRAAPRRTVRVLTVRGCEILSIPVPLIKRYRRC
jgi:lytic murein transglycosylase